MQQNKVFNVMEIKKLLLYISFLIISASTCARVPKDRTKDTTTWETPTKAQKEEAAFYQYDLFTYSYTYKLTSTILLLLQYVIATLTSVYFGKLYVEYLYITVLACVIAFLALIKANYYSYGVHSFKDRFLFWLGILGFHALLHLDVYLTLSNSANLKEKITIIRRWILIPFIVCILNHNYFSTKEDTPAIAKNQEATFYQYDFLTYLRTYKLISIITTLYQFTDALLLSVEYVGSETSVFEDTKQYIGDLAQSYLFSAVVLAILYNYGVNTFEERFFFWLKQSFMHGAIPAIIFLFIDRKRLGFLF